MIFRGIEICCPACRGELACTEGSEFHCQGCQQRYPVVCGIPDLRVFPDPYIAAEDDRAKGLKVSANFDDLDFAGLVDYYYSITSVVPPQHAQRFKRGLLSGVARAETALKSWEQVATGNPSGQTLLEIGCGTGPLLVAASHKYDKVVGVDIAFRWLVVGQKRLAESGLDVPLICACAEALPFPDGVFDYVVADSVIEHAQSQSGCLLESRRVMGSNGWLFLSTPNKLSIGPDPHTGLPAGGFLPQWISDTYVRRLGGIPPKRRLLSVISLNQLFKKCGFAESKVFLPDISAEQRASFSATSRRLIDTYQFLKRMPVSRQLLYLVGPLLFAVAQPETLGEPGHGGPLAGAL